MRLTIRTDLAIRTLMFCASNGSRTVRKHEIATACSASESHLAQVINVLAQEGYLRTTRGRNGGVALARPMDSITLGGVVRCLEGGMPLVECFAGGADTCPLKPGCRVRHALAQALETFFTALDVITLRDLVDDNEALHEILAPGRDADRCAPAPPADERARGT